MNTFKLIQTLSLSAMLTLTAMATLPNAVKAGETNQSGIGLKQNSGQSILYVNPVQGMDVPSAGSNLEQSYRSIGYALAAAKPGTEIRLLDGEYSNEQFPLQVPAGVKIVGNTATKGSNVKIVGGEDYDTKTFGRQNVGIVLGENSELYGVSVTNPNNRGTGIWIENVKAVISDSTFINNNREGIFVTGTASPIIKDSIFKNNTGNGVGFGRQAKGEVKNNTFDNTGFALSMGGEVTPFISQNKILNNNSGIVLTENAKPILQGNTIQNNREYGIIATSKANPQIQDGNNFSGNGNDMYIALSKSSTPLTNTVSKPIETTPIATNSNTYSDKVTFECAQIKGDYATVIQKDNPAILPRTMINWTRQIGSDFTPEKRCQIVTEKLNRIVAQNDGQIDNLVFTIGQIDNSSVVCLASNNSSSCDSSNLLFTLSAENAKNPRNVINSLASSIGSKTGGGSSPVVESNGNVFTSLAPLNNTLQPEKALWFANF